MKLSGGQRKKLQDALLNAFPTKPSLEQMLLYELDKKLDEIAGGIDLQETVFNLIKNADSQEWIEDLIRAARQSNPNNKKMLTIAQELFTKPEKINNIQLVRNEEDTRKRLLSRVTNYWIKEVLEEDLLYDQRIIKLEIEERHDLISNPWGKSPRINNQIKQGSLPSGIKGAIKKFNQMDIPRTLLILGEQGGGKTTILLMLTRSLIEHVNKNKDSNLPIPVVFDILKSNNQTLNFYDWFVDELCTKYKVPKEIAVSFIGNQQLLLVIDNLDKVHVERQQLYIQALNEFSQKHEMTEIIATFSIIEYERLPNRLNFQSAIYIQRPTLRNFGKTYSGKSGKKDILVILTKTIKLLLRRCYLLLNNLSIVMVLIIFIFMILVIHSPISEICNARKEHNIVKENFLRILSIDKILYERNKSYSGECFIDLVEQIPNAHYDYSGSTTWSPVNPNLLSAINDSGLPFNLNYKGAIGSLAGIKKLLENDRDLTFALSSHDITHSDEDTAEKKGFKLISLPVARDAIVIVVSRDLFNQNSTFFKKGINKEFIKSIYTDDDHKNWKQIGGPDVLINPYSRRDNSGTVEWFEENFLETSKKLSKNIIQLDETSQAVDVIAKSDKGGIFYGSAALLLPQCDVVPLSIINQKNAIAPYKTLVEQNSCKNQSQRNQLKLEAIYNKEYPSQLIRKLYVVYKNKGDSQSAGSAFANLLKTKQGQEIFEKNNFVKLQD